MLRTSLSPERRGPAYVEIRHAEPLLQLGLEAALRGDGRFVVRPTPAEDGDTMDMRSAAVAAQIVVSDYETALDLSRSPSRLIGIRVVVLTARTGEADVQRALAHGVRGYILAGCRLGELLDGIDSVAQGQRYLSRAVAQTLAEHALCGTLTARERQVLECVSVGWSNKIVGNHLGMTEGTVKTHVKAILEKLDARTRTEAAHIAQKRGLVSAASLMAATLHRGRLHPIALHPRPIGPRAEEHASL